MITKPKLDLGIHLVK